jgi:hypothetical protein
LEDDIIETPRTNSFNSNNVTPAHPTQTPKIERAQSAAVDFGLEVVAEQGEGPIELEDGFDEEVALDEEPPPLRFAVIEDRPDPTLRIVEASERVPGALGNGVAVKEEEQEPEFVADGAIGWYFQGRCCNFTCCIMPMIMCLPLGCLHAIQHFCRGSLLGYRLGPKHNARFWKWNVMAQPINFLLDVVFFVYLVYVTMAAHDVRKGEGGHEHAHDACQSSDNSTIINGRRGGGGGCGNACVCSAGTLPTTKSFGYGMLALPWLCIGHR